MVNSPELLELDPELEDILSMWGKEPTVQNVEHFFGGYDFPRLASLSQVENPHFSLPSKESSRVSTVPRDQDGHRQAVSEHATDGVFIGVSGSGTKGKTVLNHNFPPKGLEDIVNLGVSSGLGQARSIGGSFPLSRVSLFRNPPLSKGNPNTGVGDPNFHSVGAQDGLEDQSEGPFHAGNSSSGFPEHSQFPQGVNFPGFPPHEAFDGYDELGGPRVSAGDVRRTGEKRKTQRPIGAVEIERNIVLGMEVAIEETLEVADCTLVGRARGKKFSSEFLRGWGEQLFVSDRPLSFKAQSLAKGWFLLRFEDKEAAAWVLERNWFIGNIPVLMKHWNPLFDALKERMDEFPVWVRAPGLPIFLWTEAVFKTIGNTLGHFLEADMSFEETEDRAVARILVSLNPSRGLAKKVNLQYKDFVFEQVLDYEHLPFRCHICHEYGHLAKDCPMNRRRRRLRRAPFYRGPVHDRPRNYQVNEGAEE